MISRPMTKAVKPVTRKFPVLIAIAVVIVTAVFFSRKTISIVMTTPRHDHNIINDPRLRNETCAQPATIPPPLTPPSDMPQALKTYAEFHTMGRTCIVDPPSCKLSKMPNVLVWRSERGKVGGFGERLIAIRNLLMLAIATNRVFFIHWFAPYYTPFELTSAVLPAYIDWRLPEEQLLRVANFPGQVDHMVELVYHHEGGFRNPIADHTPDLEQLFPETHDMEALFKNYTIVRVERVSLEPKTMQKLATNSHAKPRLAGLADIASSYIALQRVLTDFLFVPTQTIEFLVSRRTFEPSMNYLGVHVRTGRDVAEAELDRFYHVEHDYSVIAGRFIECAKRADQVQKSKRLFLASDSLPFKQVFTKTAKAAGFEVNTVQRYAWHLDRGESDLFVNRKDHCIAFLDVFADAYALSRAKVIIYAPSYLPEVAIGMGKQVEGYVALDPSHLDLIRCTPEFMTPTTS